MSDLIKHIDFQDHDVLINICIDKYKDYINTIHIDSQSQGMSLLEKAIRLNKKDVVRKLLQSEHINIDKLYNMFKSSQFVTQLYTLLSGCSKDTYIDTKGKAHNLIHILQSINNDYCITLCANACGLKSYNDYKQFISLLEKMTTTDHTLSDSERMTIKNILYTLKKSKYQKDSVLNIYGIQNARMYAHMIFKLHNHRCLLTGNYEPQKISNLMSCMSLSPSEKNNPKIIYVHQDIARYITSYIDTRLHL
jgi:hypothetical protein